MKKLILAIAIFLGASPLWAETMTYQGRLKESDIPVSANRVMFFQFCNAETGGSCSDTLSGAQSFAVQNGLFKATFTVPTADLSQGQWFLQVSVGPDVPGLQVLTPRERLTAVPYSVFASSAGYAAGGVQKTGDTMTGQLTLDGSTLTVTGSEFSVGGSALAVKAGNVGIGSATPAYRLAVSSGAGEAGTIMAVSTGTSDLFWVAGDGAHAARFHGDGSGLTGVTGATDNTKVLKAGDTMTGPLRILSDDLANDTSDFITTGLMISTGGAIQTTGLGHGSAVGNARGNGAVDLQTYRALGTQVASGNYSVLSGGFLNKAVGSYSVVGGGYTNSAEAAYAAVGGGIGNAASGQQSTVAGGNNNAASAQYAAVGGGYSNTATLNSAVVAGGSGNHATGTAASITGGANNTASGNWSAVGGGGFNLASGNSAVVPGGAYNGALGDYSLAAGRVSSSTAGGAFTWADSEGVMVQNAVADRTVFKNRGGFLVTGSTNTSMTGALDRGVILTGSGLVGVSTGSPQAALDVVSTGTAANVYAQIWRDSTGLVVGSVSAQGVFSGDGSGLTGLSATDPNALPLTGGTLAGALNLNGNLLAGVSTINILNGIIAIVPAGTAGSNANYGVSIGSNAYNNYSSGVGMGRDSHDNHTYGVGVGAGTYNNNTYGVGVGSNAAGNYNSGVGLGRDSYGNYDHGTGVGAGANDNRVYGLGAGYNASGNRNYGLGLGAFASGNSNYAVGVGAYSDNNAGYGAALGAYSYASSSATALGAYSSASAELSLALGYGTVNNSTGTASFGDYAVNAPAYLIKGAPVLRLGTGTSTLALGHAAGGLDAGSYNLFVGSAAGYGHTSGGSNVMLGYSAGYQNTTGANNVFIGATAASTNIGGNQNIVIGSGQLTSAQGSSNELNIGGLIFGQLDVKTVGISTRAPQAALDIVSTGTAANVYAQIWRDANGTIVASMTAAGAFTSLQPLDGDDLGDHNADQDLQLNWHNIYTVSTITAAGHVSAGAYQINGSTVLAVLPGTGSLGVGRNAGRLNTSSYSVFVGDEAGYSNAVSEGNTYVGYQAGYANTGGQNSVFLGRLAGRTNTTGDSNTFLGANAGYWNTTGSYNLFLGNRAGNDNTTGSNNAFAGFYAGDGSTTGSNNALMGYQAGLYNRTGSANAALGSDAGRGTTGQSYSSSTLVGYQAGYSLNASVGNILIGYKAGYSITTGTGNIVIGYEEDVYDPADNNVLNIGGVLFGELQDRTIGINSFLPPTPVKPQAALDVISTGTLHTQFAQIWRNSNGLEVGSMSATGSMQAARFVGDGAGLTNVTAAGAVQKTGDSMTGPLYINGTGASAPLKVTLAAAGDLITASLSAGATAVIYADNSSVGYFSDQTAHRVGLGAGRTEVLTVTQNRVGANNTSPYYTLDVNGPGRFADQVIAGGSVTVAGSAFSVGASTFVVKAGRVGINWSTPEAALQVSGGAKFLLDAGTSYILTAGSAAKPDMFFVSSGGIVGAGDFTGMFIDTYAVVNVAPVLKPGADGAVGLTVLAHTDSSNVVNANGPDHVLAGGNFEAAVWGDDTVTLLAALRTKLRRESAGAGLVSKAYGLLVDDIGIESGAGVITDSYGIYIGDQTSAFGGTQTNAPYALYSQDPGAKIFLAGNLGLANEQPAARLDLSAAASDPGTMAQIWRDLEGDIVSSMSATGVMTAAKFLGDGSGLTGLSGVQKTGDTMTGDLTILTTTYLGLQIRDSNGTTMPELRLARDAGAYWDIGGAGGGTPLVFQYAGVNRMFLASDGHLTLNDSGQVVSRLHLRPAVIDSYSLYISSADGSTPALTVRPGGQLYTAGRVGIGRSDPEEALDISDRVQISTRSGGNDVTDGLISKGTGGMEFFSGGAKYLKVANGGNFIGIGPNANVDSTTNSPRLQVKGSMSVGADYGGSKPLANSLVVQARLGVGTPTPDAALHVVQSDVVASSYTVHIGTSASAYHLVVTTAGWVGLNTRQPQAPLHLTAATKDEGIVVEHNSNTSEGSYLALLKARGTVNSQNLVQDGDNLGVLAYGGYNSTPGDPFPMAAAIVGRVDGTPTVSAPDMPGRLEFMTAADGTNETVTRMVIKNNGAVGISTNTPEAMLDIRSTLPLAQVWRDSAGVVTASMTATGEFFANIPGLGDKVSRTGDTMVGPLTISAPLTVAVADLDADGFDLTTTGITISTSGALQTQGFGDGTASPGARGVGAVDLQTGRTNTAQVAGGAFSVVGGGEGNTVSSGADYAAVSGGQGNTASGNYSVVAGGKNNYASNYYSVVGGGYGNTATSVSDNAAAVLSGNSNATRAARSVIAGGSFNLITATSSFVGGGGYNVAHGTYAVITGGESNTAPGMYSALAGGQKNTTSGLYSFVGGGYMNVANGEKSVLGGGTFNTGDAQYGVITGGYENKMQSGATSAFIGGGSGNLAAGQYSAVPGGQDNTAKGNHSFAAGYMSSSTANGAFTWADSQGVATENSVQDRVRFKARGGFLVSGSTNTADAGFFVSGDGSVTMGNGLFISNRGAVQTTGLGTNNVAPGTRDATAVDLQNHREYNYQVASAYLSVISGGGSNEAGDRAAVGGGQYNDASGMGSAIAGGYNNTASGPYSVVPGGESNSASSDYSFAAGRYAQSAASGTFTWSDSQGVVTQNSVQDQVRFKARGGFVVSGSTNIADPKFMVTGAGDALLDNDRKLAWGAVPAPYITGNDSSDLLAFGLNSGEKMKLQSSQLTLYNASVVLSTTSANAGITFQDGSVQTSAAPRVVSIYKPDAEVRTLDGTATPDSHLKFFVGPNEKWAFEFNLYVYTTDTTGTADMRVGLVGPAANQLRAQYDLYAENGLTVNAGGMAGAYGEYVVNWTGTVPGVGTRAVVKGTIENSATGGTMAITWGQNVSTAVNTTVLKGSYLIAHKLN